MRKFTLWAQHKSHLVALRLSIALLQLAIRGLRNHARKSLSAQGVVIPGDGELLLVARCGLHPPFIWLWNTIVTGTEEEGSLPAELRNSKGLSSQPTDTPTIFH